jgi:hypothetical protein
MAFNEQPSYLGVTMVGEGGSGKGRADLSSEKEFINQLVKALPKLTTQAREDFDRLRDPNHERKKKELEIGWLGRFIGDHDSAPTRLALIVIVLCASIVIPVALLIAYRHDDSALLDKIITSALTLISGALGFAFGRGTNAQKPPRK